VGRKKAEAVSAQWFQILLSIVDGPLHGAAIMEEVLERTDGSVRLWPGALYGSLSELFERGWIRETEAPEGRRRKEAVAASGRSRRRGAGCWRRK